MSSYSLLEEPAALPVSLGHLDDPEDLVIQGCPGLRVAP